MDEREKKASERIVAHISAKMCPTQKELRSFQNEIHQLSTQGKTWAETVKDLNPRRTAVFVADQHRPRISLLNRQKYAESIVGKLIFLMEYGYSTVLVEAKSEYGLLALAIFSKMKASGLNFQFQEFGLAALETQWDLSSSEKLPFELTPDEYDDFMETRVSLAIYPNGLAFNSHILPKELIERMRGNRVTNAGED